MQNGDAMRLLDVESSCTVLVSMWKHRFASEDGAHLSSFCLPTLLLLDAIFVVSSIVMWLVMMMRRRMADWSSELWIDKSQFLLIRFFLWLTNRKTKKKEREKERNSSAASQAKPTSRDCSPFSLSRLIRTRQVRLFSPTFLRLVASTLRPPPLLDPSSSPAYLIQT